MRLAGDPGRSARQTLPGFLTVALFGSAASSAAPIRQATAHVLIFSAAKARIPFFPLTATLERVKSQDLF